MKAAIYNPYLDTLGGGERYTVAFAKVLMDASYKVDIEWPDAEIKKKLESRFGYKLTDLNFVKDIKRGDGYDVCFWLSDGSIPTLKARKNLLHFQFPFKDVGGRSLLNKMKLFRINKVVCNSNFTKTFIDKEYGIKSVVIYPPIDVKQTKSKRKENLIIYVGRFSRLTQLKRQDVLVDAFKILVEKRVKNWKLILAGGVEVGVGSYLKQLVKKSKSYSIKIVESPDYKTLLNLYSKAKIFWSASGYGVDESKEPMKVEHFGMTVVEAMTHGCVPFAYSAGGHKEIIKNGENGFLWIKKRDLIGKTLKLIKDREYLEKLSKSTRKDSRRYGYERFETEVLGLL